MKYLLSEIAAICGGVLLGADGEVHVVVSDSRSLSCEFGDKPLFIAMKGINHDSHDYIGEMYGRGVRGFIVEHNIDNYKSYIECGFVQVKSAIEALQSLATHHRAQFKGVVVGVTGSNGKTTIKEWIVNAMPTDIKVFRSPKSYNSQLGVALSLLLLEGDESLAIIEAGISMCGEMAKLEQMIKPDIVLFTSIGDAHQENFETIEEKCIEKSILAKDAKVVIYNSYYEPLATTILNIYSNHSGHVEALDDNGFYGDGRKIIDAAMFRDVTKSCLDADAMGRNAELVEAFFVEMKYPIPPLSQEPSVAMRLEVKEGINGSILINDAYNLDVNSLALAVDYMHIVAFGRERTLILSDIHQSGLPDKELYSRVAEMIKRAGISVLIGVGERIRKYASLFSCNKEFYLSTDEAIRSLSHEYIADRVVLLKGGRCFRFEKIAHALEKKSHTTLLEVNIDAMIHNLNYFRAKLEYKTKLVAMVKATGYGTGDFEIAQMLQHQGVDYLAVAFADEGVILRERGITMPIMVLNADADSFGLMVENCLEPEIYSLHSLKTFSQALERQGVAKYPIHIKLDVGMHRLGFVESEIDDLIITLQNESRVSVKSLFAHLSCADMAQKDEYTRGQIAKFDHMSSRIASSLPYKTTRHLANSAAIERFPESHFDMCRLGLGLYGFGYIHNQDLRPVSTLKSRIVQIKQLDEGDIVGYGAAGNITRPTTIATIPVGYADGLNRHLGSGTWSMLVNGVTAPIVGRICMDSCMIDITDAGEVAEGDEVVVFSPAKGNNIEDMAKVLNTIPYEIMTLISGRVKRIYIKE